MITHDISLCLTLKCKPMKSFNDLDVTTDARQPLADITNAPYLFGDPVGDIDLSDDETGDEDGDFDYGDVTDDDEVDALSTYQLISGDPEIGAPTGQKAKNFYQKYKAPIWGIAGAGAGVAAGMLAAKALARARAKRAYKNKLMRYRQNQSLRAQRIVTRSIRGLSRLSMMPFFQISGAKMNAAPIDPSSRFIADMFKQMLDRQAMDTPFYQETAIGTFAGGNWTAQAQGVATTRYFTGLFIQIGTNILNAAPGTIIRITANIPTIAGTLTISSQPFILTYEKGFDVRFLFFPWQLVANRALPVLGAYSSANPIVVTVNGIPAASAVNVVVPGSLHPWTVAMRSALMRP